MRRLAEHFSRHRDGYGPLVAALILIVVFLFAGMQFTANGEERESWCKTYIHLLTVLPDGRITVPGKSGHWGDIDHYVELEVKGGIVSVKTGNYNSRVTIVERRCGE